MKQVISNPEANSKCNGQACHKCADCKAVNFEERRQEWKNSSSQLYAKESEHYFFYYELNMKQR